MDLADPDPGQLLTTDSDQPWRLEVSTASKTKPGVVHITFAKAPGRPTVKCRGIWVTVPIGTTESDLTSTFDLIEYGYSGLGSTVTPNQNTKSYHCVRSGPKKIYEFDATSHFTLILKAIPVSRLPGAARLAISAEVTTAETPTESDWIVQNIDADDITKFVDDHFYFTSFSCVEPQVANPGTAELHWNGSDVGTEYWLSYNDKPAYRVTGQSTTVGGLTDITTFVLDARTPNPETNVFDQHHYLSTTVTVKEPTIEAKSLTATDRIAIADTFSAVSSTRTTTAFGPTTFEGDVTVMAGNKLTVNDIASGNGTVAINAAVTAKAATVDSLDARTGEIKTSGALTGGTTTVTSLNAGGGEIKTTGALTGGAATVSSLDARSGEIKTSGALKGGDTNVSSLTATGTVAGANVTANGRRVIRVEDVINLEVNSHDKKLWLYCQTGNKDNVYGAWENQYLNSNWRVHHYSSPRAAGDPAAANDVDPAPRVDDPADVPAEG